MYLFLIKCSNGTNNILVLQFFSGKCVSNYLFTSLIHSIFRVLNNSLSQIRAGGRSRSKFISAGSQISTSSQISAGCGEKLDISS